MSAIEVLIGVSSSTAISEDGVSDGAQVETSWRTIQVLKLLMCAGRVADNCEVLAHERLSIVGVGQ